MSQLITKDLSVGYDQKKLIEKIELEVKDGQIVCLIGPNGAGKSTILKTLSGFLSPLDGCVYYDGQNLKELSLSERAKNIAVMMTGRNSEEYLTVFDVVSAGRYPYTGLLGKLSEEDLIVVDNALKTVGAYEQKEREFAKLSDGQKQRVLLARAIAQCPSIMILDEPTSFLDIGYKVSFLKTLRQLAKETKMGVLMSMHELEMAAIVADTIVSISLEGSIDRIGSPSEVFQAEYIEKLFHVEKGLLQDIYQFQKEEDNGVPSVVRQKKNHKAHFIMVQGTMSNAGKSLLCAGLCRIFKQDGYKVAPFKSQNMALNSFVTEDGLEMGRAQVMQAEAAGIKPKAEMNPILLKPTSDAGSQVIVNGKVLCNMSAKEYFAYKKQLIPEIKKAIDALEKDYDVIVIEGAGSPAEINLKENDIVNMGMAKMVDAPVLLVGDIDRGGVFAQLLGTVDLLEADERTRIGGFVINKFRGDVSLLSSGLSMLEEKCNIPVMGVVPYMHLHLEDEDSLSEKFNQKKKCLINIGVVKLPHISNFTDFDAFEQVPQVGLRYITRIGEVEDMDLLILPGSKNTIDDMRWLKETGLESAIKKYASKNRPLLGICGGYQMLGQAIADPYNVECGGVIDGLGLLPIKTVLSKEKCQSQVERYFEKPIGIFETLAGVQFTGYEIHAGETMAVEEVRPFTSGSGYCKGNIAGTYVHGIFDSSEVLKRIVSALAKEKDLDLNVDAVMDYANLKELEYDKLAKGLRDSLDMKAIYKMMGLEHK